MKRFFLALGFFLLSVCFTGAASAFSLRPAITDISLDPGGSYKGSFQVFNDEAASHTYYLSIQKFIPSGETGQQEFLPPSNISGLPQWIFLSSPSITLKPGEEADVPFTIYVPSEAQAGGYYAAVFFSTTPPVASPQGGVLAGARTGALVLLKVKGALQERVVLRDFALETAPSLTALPASVRVSVENQGNVHVVPQGQIEVKNSFGQTVYKGQINPENQRVLPGSARRFVVSWQKNTPHTGQGFWFQVKEEWRNFALGRYTIELHLSNVTDEVKVASPLSFAVWPWHLGVCVLLGLIILFVLGRLYRHWLIRRLTA
jgi:hypothetical protein